MKVDKDIITSIAASLIGWAPILVIMNVDTFKTEVIVIISNVITCLTDDNLQYQFVDKSVDSTNWWEQKKKCLNYNVLINWTIIPLNLHPVHHTNALTAFSTDIKINCQMIWNTISERATEKLWFCTSLCDSHNKNNQNQQQLQWHYKADEHMPRQWWCTA